MIIESPSDYWYGITAQAGAMPAQTQPTTLNSPIWPTSVTAKDTDRSGWWSAKMKTALPMETPRPADSSPSFNDHIPLHVQWMTENKDISTNCHLWCPRKSSDFLFWELNWRSKGGQHFSATGIPTTEIPHVTQSSRDFHASTATINWPETLPLLIADYNCLTTGQLSLKSRHSKNLVEIKE